MFENSLEPFGVEPNVKILYSDRTLEDIA